MPKRRTNEQMIKALVKDDIFAAVLVRLAVQDYADKILGMSEDELGEAIGGLIHPKMFQNVARKALEAFND